MSLVVNHNMMAAGVARNLNAHYGRLSTSTERLSTGLRINSAADDAAGLAIRELMRADIASLQQGARNANDAISLIQTADGALGIIDEKLIRMKELAEQAATGTYDSTQRLMIESEYQQMASEITRIAIATDFNGVHLLDGSLSGTHNGSGLNATGKMKIHFGTGNDSAEDYYYIEIGNCTAAALGLGNNALIDESSITYTKDMYEDLRDKAAEAAYNNTVNLKYPDFYNTFYTQLITGDGLNPGLDADAAHKLAHEQALELAQKYAENDSDMIKAAYDKLYDESFQTNYLTLWQSYVDAGDTASDAAAKAQSGAIKKALESLYSTSQNIVDTPDVSLLGLPALNEEWAKAFISQAQDDAEIAIFNRLYDKLYDDAITKVNADTSIITPLTQTQVKEIATEVFNQAKTEASTLAARVGTAFTETYESGYDSVFSTQLALYRSEGYPEEIALSKAQYDASIEGWTKLKNAVTTAKGGTAIGDTGVALVDADFAVDPFKIDVPTDYPTVTNEGLSDYATTFIDGVKAQFESVYRTDIYNEIRNDIAKQIIAEKSLTCSARNIVFTENQDVQIKDLTNKILDTMFAQLGDDINDQLTAIYQAASDTVSSTSPSYIYYYQEGIDLGMSDTDADTYAKTQAGSIIAWEEIKKLAETGTSTILDGVSNSVVLNLDYNDYLNTALSGVSSVTFTDLTVQDSSSGTPYVVVNIAGTYNVSGTYPTSNSYFSATTPFDNTVLKSLIDAGKSVTKSWLATPIYDGESRTEPIIVSYDASDSPASGIYTDL